MDERHKKALEWADTIEAEMRSAGMWSEEPLPEEAYHFTKAFAMDTMPYERWLQFIFLPRVREIANEAGSFPASSSVGAQAIREFDGWDQAGSVVTALCEFDAWIERR